MFSVDPIRSTADAAKVMMENFKDADREYFVAVNLDTQNKPISYSIVSSGDVNHVCFPITSVFKTALLQNATSIIICHNHPGGTSTASVEDILATEEVVAAGKVLGIRVLDHFILTPYDYVSMKETHSDIFN